MQRRLYPGKEVVRQPLQDCHELRRKTNRGAFRPVGSAPITALVARSIVEIVHKLSSGGGLKVPRPFEFWRWKGDEVAP